VNVCAAHPTLELQEKVFDVVRGLPVLAYLVAALVPAMLDCFVVGKFAANLGVKRRFISVQRRCAMHVGNENVANRLDVRLRPRTRGRCRS
jgi:hypothetical protein